MSAIDQFNVRGKVAIVTGSNRGLGSAMAAALAGGGADVVITGRQKADVDRVAAEIADEFAVRTVGFTGDLVDAEVVERLVATAVDELGGLHIVVNNAGVNIRGPIDGVSVDDFDCVLDINAKAPWLLCRAAAPIFKAQRWGRVINIASVLGMVGKADRSLYCASKGALVQLTRQLAVEWAGDNITVNAICPGPFETEMNRPITEDPKLYAQYASYTAMKRWGRMDEIGPPVLFLASDAASYITGAVLPVDGGWLAW